MDSESNRPLTREASPVHLSKRPLSGPGKPRRTAQVIWDSLKKNNPSHCQNDVVRLEHGVALGPRLIVRAVLDLAQAPLELSWTKGGLSESFVRKGKGEWAQQNCGQFLDVINTVLSTKFRRERCPADLFDRTYYDVGEVAKVCLESAAAVTKSLPGGLPNVDKMAGGEPVKSVQAKLTLFAQSPGHGIFVLQGGPADGKKSAFARALSEVNTDKRVALYLSGLDLPSYPQIIRHLYLSLIPPERRKSDPGLAGMVGQVEEALCTQPLVVVFNAFDVLENQLDNGEIKISEEWVFRLLDLLMSPRAKGTRLLIGTHTSFNCRHSHELEHWAKERSIEFGSGRVPSLSLEHGTELISRNPLRHPNAAACYSVFIREVFAKDTDIPTLVIIALAALFSFSNKLPPLQPRALTKSLKWLSGADFEADSWGKFLKDWSVVRDAVREHDVRTLLGLLLKSALKELVAALRLIALSDDGLRASTLETLLEFRCPDPDRRRQLVRQIHDGALQPVVQKGVCEIYNGGTEARFDTNRTFRRYIVMLCQEDKALLGEIRSYHASLARMALSKHRYEFPERYCADRTAGHRRPIKFFRHELASLDPGVILDTALSDREKYASDLQYKALGEKVLQGSATREERFCYTLLFFEREIQDNNEPGLFSTRAADALRLNLLLATFHIGFLLPPRTSLLATKQMSLPSKLPFRSDRPVAGLCGRHSDGVAQALGELKGVVKLLNAAGQADLERAGINIETRQKAVTTVEQVIETLGSPDGEEKNPYKACDQWTLWLYREIAICALRIDLDSVLFSANNAGEDIAKQYKDHEAQWQFQRNLLSWRLRRGDLLAGEDAALTWTHDLESVVQGEIACINARTQTGNLDAYKSALRAYHWTAGRLADFAAARGSYKLAFERYGHLAESSLVSPVSLHKVFDHPPALGGHPEQPECLRGSSARHLVRFAWRVYMLFTRMTWDDPIRGLTHDALMVDRNVFEAKDLRRMVETARKVLHREAGLADFLPQGSGEEMAVAIERAAMHRFNDLLAAPGDPDFLGLARKNLDLARRASLTGNISVMRHIRLLLEEARFCWHSFVFQRAGVERPCNQDSLLSHLSNALKYANRVVAISELRSLPLYHVDALLLRTEIVLFCIRLTERDDELPSHLRALAVTPTVRCLVEQQAKLPVKDLAKADARISEIGYRKRIIELFALRNRPGSTPCAYLIT